MVGEEEEEEDDGMGGGGGGGQQRRQRQGQASSLSGADLARFIVKVREALNKGERH